MFNEKYLSECFIYELRDDASAAYITAHYTRVNFNHTCCSARACRPAVNPNTLKSGQSEFALIARAVH